ncbi:hypothetical protein BRADI_4g09253v3 [Brachypodium distachyon]|uniref:Membrane protein insertion efficiency factor YidD n=1 Tax=Brachypodium distachyon TaxID=15368 RepID=A0A0Q3EL46_BRADI|nr:hypothetical protein BRADI_4g09253v3 [Brachypodium distachyon]
MSAWIEKNLINQGQAAPTSRIEQPDDGGGGSCRYVPTCSEYSMQAYKSSTLGSNLQANRWIVGIKKVQIQATRAILRGRLYQSVSSVMCSQ